MNGAIHTLQAVNKEMEKLRPLGSKSNRFPKHIIILARNKVGLKNLYQLISASNLKYFKRVPTIPKSELMAHREGLIIGSACEAGELFKAVVDHKDWDELKRIASFYDYLEIQPLCNNAFMLRNGEARSEEDLREFNRIIVRLGEELGKPVCATGDVHFREPEDEVYRHILLASKKFPDANEPLPIYFKTTQEMLEEFQYLGEEKAYEVVVTNTRLVADQIETFELLPAELFPPRLENSEEDLNRLVWEKVHRLYGEDPPQLIVDRLNVELGGILGKYDVVYMSAQKLVQRSNWNAAIWLAPEAPSARRWWLICPALRRSTPCRPTTAAPSARTVNSSWTAATAAARICRIRFVPFAVRSTSRTDLTFPLRPSWASAAARCRIST